MMYTYANIARGRRKRKRGGVGGGYGIFIHVDGGD